MTTDPVFSKIYYYSGTANNGNFVEVDGVNSLTIQKQLSFAERFSLGGINSSYNLNAPQEIKVSFERSFVQNDFLFNFTGSEPIKRFVAFDGKKYYEISNLYLDSYSASFSVGALPRIATNFTAYGENVIQKNQLNFDGEVKSISENVQFELPSLNSISVTGNFDSNIKDKFNIYQFDYNLTIKRQPFYSVGSTVPVNVSQILPLDISVSMTSKVPESSIEIQMPEYFSNTDSFLNFDINVSGEATNYLFKLPVRNGRLISSEIRMSTSDILDLNRGIVGNYGL